MAKRRDRLRKTIIAAVLRWQLAERMLESLHEGQEEFIWPKPVDEDSGVDQDLPGDHGFVANFVALLSDRRFGKTYGALLYACALCQTIQNCSILYISMQRSSAATIAWPVLEKLARRFPEMGALFDERALTVTFPATNAKIALVGADHQKFAKLLRGGEHDLVIVDEAQDFAYIDLRVLVDSILSHTLDDRGGRLFLTGTPGDTETGYFYEVCVENRHTQWHVVHAKPFSNPANRKKRLAKARQYKRANPDVEKEPWYRREFLGEWVADTRLLMVTLRESLNYLYEWKPQDGDHYVLTIDWGFDQPSAYVLGAWNPKRNNQLVYLEGWEQKEMGLKDHLAAIGRYTKHPTWGRNLRIVADPGGQSKAITEEIRRTYKIPVEDAIKDGKDLMLAQVKMETSLGDIKIYNIHDPLHPEDCGVAKQWNKLTWKIDPKTKEKTEGAPRHTHDAALYLRRATRPEIYEPPKEDDRTDGQKIYDLKAARVRARLRRKKRAR